MKNVICKDFGAGEKCGNCLHGKIHIQSNSCVGICGDVNSICTDDIKAIRKFKMKNLNKKINI